MVAALITHRTSTPMTAPTDPDAWARLRFAIVGPLLATPPEGRTLRPILEELAERTWTHPRTGLGISFGVSTIERWYYIARAADDPVRALRRRRRADAGGARVLSSPMNEAIRAQYRAHPGWTMQLHLDNLVALGATDPALGAVPSYSTLRRFLRANALGRVRRPRRASAGALAAVHRLETRETRSYEVSHVHGLWHLDFHHGSHRVLESDGRWITPMLLGVIDDHSRLVCHLQWYRDESAEALVHGFKQAIAKRGLPRSVMSDNGAAMTSAEFTTGLERLGIVHDTTLPYSPQQNGKQESFWGNVEGRLLAMLEGQGELTLARLNELSQVWVEGDYHRARHSEIGCSPLERYVGADDVGREPPGSAALSAAFRRRVTRRQRRSDGTASLEGRRFEIPGRFSHLERVTLAYARWDLSRVDLLDPGSGEPVCSVRPLDRQANATGARRALAGAVTVGGGDAAANAVAPSAAETSDAVAGAPTTLPPLMQTLLARFGATGLPPGFLPSPPGKGRDAASDTTTQSAR